MVSDKITYQTQHEGKYMKKAWSKERTWEPNKIELLFEELLDKDNFNVIGIKVYLSKTDYLIEKNGIECEFSIPHIDNKPSRAKQCYKNFLEYYNIKVEYEKLKTELSKKDS